MVEKPTNRWRECIPEDSFFTEESVAETERVLDAYQERLLEIQNEDQEKLLAELQRVISELNHLGGCFLDEESKYPGLIDTLEREELCEYIVSLAEDAGLRINPNDYEYGDITFQWRHW